MISVLVPSVRGYTLDFLDVSWEVGDTAENLDDFSFTVQRSESPEGPFEVVSGPARLRNQFFFRDLSVDLKARWRIFFYRIEVKADVANTVGYSPVTYFAVQPDRAALEMVRGYQLQLKTQIGAPVLIFKRRTSGPYCPECYDPILKRTNRSDCAVCFASTYNGGFYDPIPSFVNLSGSVKGNQQTPSSELEPHERNADMSAYPPVSPGDLIVDAINRRFRVQSVQCREKQLFVIRQIIRLAAISLNDVLQKLPVDPTKFPTRAGVLWPLPAQFGPIKHVVDDSHRED